jgi:hypothetical protein
MKTDLQLRKERFEEIVILARLRSEQDRVVLAQLDSFSSLGIEVMHSLICRVAFGETDEREDSLRRSDRHGPRQLVGSTEGER